MLEQFEWWTICKIFALIHKAIHEINYALGNSEKNELRKKRNSFA